MVPLSINITNISSVCGASLELDDSVRGLRMASVIIPGNIDSAEKQKFLDAFMLSVRQAIIDRVEYLDDSASTN